MSGKKQIPNITNLHAQKNLKTQAKNEIFTIVLNKCIEKIIETNTTTEKTFIYFEVPNIIIGFHSYDRIGCIHYLIQELSREKYRVDFIEPYFLYIDWGTNTKSKGVESINYLPTSNPSHLKQQTKELLKKYPNTSKIVFEYEDNQSTKNALLKIKKNKK
jgi:hypothetical protein